VAGTVPVGVSVHGRFVGVPVAVGTVLVAVEVGTVLVAVGVVVEVGVSVGVPAGRLHAFSQPPDSQ